MALGARAFHCAGAGDALPLSRLSASHSRRDLAMASLSRPLAEGLKAALRRDRPFAGVRFRPWEKTARPLIRDRAFFMSWRDCVPSRGCDEKGSRAKRLRRHLCRRKDGSEYAALLGVLLRVPR